jgi:pyruvate/2-oxoglutarate dehydrogenase complex dihydrolipoamide dehydrogenase (E3) component
MLAGTLVYVNAGTQLARIDSLSGILSPEVLLSFALLGIFPLLAKQTAQWVQKRRVYARWTRPRSFDRNLIVIGAGAAGLVSAYIGATVKAKVTLIEAGKMGGDCLNYGCVPSKALIRSAKLAHQMATADRYGLERTMPRFSFKAVMARVHEVIRTIEPHDSVERYTRLGVEVLRGYAKIVDPWTVEIALTDGGIQRLTTRSIIIAAGARPVIPDVPGLDAVGYVTSDTVWDEFAKLDEAPKRLVVLGGGPIGCELAQCFARLGSQVTQIVRGARILEREDQDVSSLAQTALEADGVEILTEHDLLYCEKNGERKTLVVKHADVERRIEFDALLCATGRTARLEGYGLEALGIPTGHTVLTDEYLETIYPNIYAAGDVAGPYQFTHTAAHQAWYAAVNALFGDLKRFKADYSAVPWTTFIDPEVARVGLNEQEAREKNIPFELTRYDIGDLDRAIADSAAYGFVKVLTVPGKDKILGVTIVGEHAGDLLAEYVLAMKHGLGLNKILGTIHTYPTLGEANKHAAGEWKLAHAPQRLLAWALPPMERNEPFHHHPGAE